MSRKLSAVTGVFILMYSFALASDTRIASLGYKSNFYVRDYHNITLFPSAVTNYKNTFFIESLGMGQHVPSSTETVPGTGMWRGGFFVKLTERFSLGFILDSRREDISKSDTEFSGLGGLIERTGIMTDMGLSQHDISGTEASHRISMVGGMRMSSIDIGFSLTTHTSEMSYTNPETSDLNFSDELKSSLFTIGVSTKAGRRARLEGSIMYHNSDFRHVESARDTAQYRSPSGYNSFGGSARLFYAFTKRVILVPFVNYISGSSGYTSLVDDLSKNSNTKSYKESYSIYTAGLGFDILPTDRSMVIIAAGITGRTNKTETVVIRGTAPLNHEYSYRAFPFISAGFETNLTSWMGVRASCYELLENLDVTNLFETGDNVTMKESGFDAVFGLWFSLGKLTLDAIVDTGNKNDFLHNPLQFFSNPESPLFSQISLTYNF